MFNINTKFGYNRIFIHCNFLSRYLKKKYVLTFNNYVIRKSIYDLKYIY